MIVIDTVPVTASEYKPNFDSCVPQGVYDFASKLSWNPMPVYVVDVVESDRGYKVVEYNQFGTSGVYNSDQMKVIDALEDMYG